jgi:antitoxin CptB
LRDARVVKVEAMRATAAMVRVTGACLGGRSRRAWPARVIRLSIYAAERRTIAGLNKQCNSELLYLLIPSEHSRDNHFDLRRQRLLFRCWHRGTQESDLILGPFAETSLKCFDSSQLDRLEALLDCTDPDLFDWILGGFTPPPEHDHDVMQMPRYSGHRRGPHPWRTGGVDGPVWKAA